MSSLYCLCKSVFYFSVYIRTLLIILLNYSIKYTVYLYTLLDEYNQPSFIIKI